VVSGTNLIPPMRLAVTQLGFRRSHMWGRASVCGEMTCEAPFIPLASLLRLHSRAPALMHTHACPCFDSYSTVPALATINLDLTCVSQLPGQCCLAPVISNRSLGGWCVEKIPKRGGVPVAVLGG